LASPSDPRIDPASEELKRLVERISEFV